MKKKTDKKKAVQKKKPIVRFRELGNGFMAEVKEVPTRGGKKHQVQIEALLLKILEEIEKSKDVEHSAVLLEKLFEILGIYFKTKAHEEGTLVLKGIQEKFSSVAALFRQKDKLTKNVRVQAVGQFVEALFHFGMPRVQAIPAVAKWLPYGGDSSVRDANKAYRKKGDLLAKTPNFEYRLLSSPHMPAFIEWFGKYKKFPTSHSTAEKAFQKMYEIVSVAQKKREERDDIIRLFNKPRLT